MDYAWSEGGKQMKIINQEEKEWLKRKGYFKKILLTKDDLKSESDILVQIVKNEPYTNVKPHYHKQTTEIFYILSDNGIFFINDNKNRHKPGDAILCEPRDIHGVINDGDEEFISLVFKINPVENDIHWVEE